MTGRLQTSLVELVALVGMDGDSGLKAVTPQPPLKTSAEEEEDESVFTTALEPQVLAAVSGHLAVYPYQSPCQDKNYPPKSLKTPGTSLQAPFQSLPRASSVDPSCVGSPPTPVMKRRITRRISFAAMARKPCDVARSVTVGPTELPVSYEVLNSLGPFCFPDYAYAHRDKQEDHIHFLVLTDISGIRSYASCLTFYRPFIIMRDSDESDSTSPMWRCALWPKDAEPDLEDDSETLVYLPACLVLISSRPYFTTMKDCLSRLMMRINNDPEDINLHLKDFALQLTMIPCPPAGQLAINFLMDQVVFTLHPPSAPGRPVVDIPLNLIFECFPLTTVLRLVVALLVQAKIIFVSSSYALLTVITESLLTFIQPFHWWLPYVPILSEQLLELVDAPGTFIMGCHSSHKHQIEGVEGLIVADINSGELTVCPTLELPALPAGVVSVFEASYQRLQCHFDVFSIERRSAFMYEEMRAMRQQYQRQFNHDITQAFLHLMVGLFRDVIPYLKIERRFFHSDHFFECLQDSEKPFYQKVLQTDMFHQFLKDRFALKTDYWSELEEKVRSLSRNSMDMDRSPNPRMSRTGSLLSNSLFLMSPTAECRPLFASTSATSLPSLTHLQLPNFTPELYMYTYDRMIASVNEKLQECRSGSQRGPLLYLRGVLKAANGNIVSALEDFHNTAACDARLFPTQVVSEILRSLNGSAKDTLYKSSLYQKSEQIQSLLDQKQGVTEQRIIMDFDKIPKKHVDQSEFAQLVEMLEIVNDQDSITRLFEALTLSKARTLDPETFELFYECWKETEMQLGELSIPDLKLEASECFLKASNMIKTSVGTGRIAMTQKRLIFLREGSDKHREIVKLRDIKSIEKVTMTSFLNQVPALRITPNGGNKVSACVVWLKEARDTWYMMLLEIWSGKLISEELRDPAIIQQAAHNVLLLDTVLQSGIEAYAAHSSERQKAAGHMCYFTRRREQGVDRLPPETKDVLQHRVDPNVQQTERRAVEALLYTAGNRSGPEEDHRPQLWCGMADGKLQVFDASTWLLEPQHFQAKDRIVCLVAVGEAQVWAGSFDSSIYVIDVRTKTCHQSLFEHTDMVCGMTVVDSKRMVYSASLNGELIGWNMDSLQLMSQIALAEVHSLRAVEYHNQQLWCCCGSELVTVTLSGMEVSRAVYMEGDMAHQIDCFLITPHNEVWLGCGRRGEIAVLSLDTLALSKTLKVECRGISKMVQVQDRVWVGSKSGKIYIFCSRTHRQEKCLKAHSDAIRSLCSAQARYVMSGAGSNDGKVAIWRTSAVE